MYNRYIIVLLAVNLFGPISGAVANEGVEVPFLFTEDQALSNTNFID